MSVIETITDAVEFVRESYGDFEMLDTESSRSYRVLWRERFLPPKHRARHRCGGCRGRWSIIEWFDWDGLFTSPYVYLRNLPTEAEVVDWLASKQPLRGSVSLAVFFERCDLPVFVLPIERVLRPMEDKVDLYLAPLEKPSWTLVYTHEEWTLGAERLND